MWDPKTDTAENLMRFLERVPLGRMEEAYQEAARQELKRRDDAIKGDDNLGAPCPTCLAHAANPCLDGEGKLLGGSHSDRAKIAKVRHLLARVKHLL